MPKEALPSPIGKPNCLPNVVAQESIIKDQREIKKIAMDVLHDEREGTLAQIGLARLAHRAGRRVGPERFVISASIIITGEPEPARRPENQERGREVKASPATNPVLARTSYGANHQKFPANKMARCSCQKNNSPLKCRPGRINNKRAKAKKTSNGCVHQASRRIVSPKERRERGAETEATVGSLHGIAGRGKSEHPTFSMRSR